jgi:hypothetical protein
MKSWTLPGLTKSVGHSERAMGILAGKRRLAMAVGLTAIGLAVAVLIAQRTEQTVLAAGIPAAGHAMETYGKLPMSFEANQGQTDSQVKFLARGAGYTLFLTGEEAVLALRDAPPRHLKIGEEANEDAVRNLGAYGESVVRMRLLGARSGAAVTGFDPQSGTANYFRGQDPKNWHAGVPIYSRVRYNAVYPGVDLIYYGNQGQLEYDFAVAPQADASAIALDFSGDRGLKVDAKSGDLLVAAGSQELRFHRPVAYQMNGGQKQLVSAGYAVAGNRAHFELGSYDHSRELVIDPTLSYSTYLGGSADDYGNALAVDNSGNVYVTGYTASVNFPIVAGYQTQCGGSCAGGTSDAFVTKINSGGTALTYSTYLGGSANDYGNGIAIDSSGNAYIVGQTFSSDFPTTAGSYMTSCGSTCSVGFAFVTKLNSSGSALSYSTYLGGQTLSQGNAIALDSSNNAYITGYTRALDFPITSGVFQPTCGSCSLSFTDVFITKFNSSGSSLIYSSFLGGNNADVGYGLVLDSSQNVYITGYTISTNFPTTPGAYQTTIGAQTAAFITKINSGATAMLYSTYLGGSGTGSNACAACGSGITVTSSGNAVVAGLTWETNFPTTSGSYQTTYGGGFHDAFVTEMNSSGSALVYSTYLGGSLDDGATAIVQDSTGNLYIRGNTFSSNYPVSPGSYQQKQAGSGGTTSDAFVSVLNNKLVKLLYSTYLGGTQSEYGLATQNIALGTGTTPSFYVTGNTKSTNFPTVAGSYQTANAGKNDAFISRFAPSPNVGLSAALNFGNQNVGTTSAPQNVTVTNTGNKNLNITAITFTGTNPGDFSQTNTCSVAVAAGKTCTISVSFTPAATGARSANLSITDNAPDSPESLAVSGTGVSSGSPAVSLNPTSLTFATQLVGTTSPGQTVTLTNTGTGALSITSITSSGDYAQTNNCGSTVNAGASCTITVTFTPTAPNTRTGAVTITDNAPDSPQSVSLTGTGTYVELVPTSLTFASQKIGTTSPGQTVTLTNTGVSSLGIRSISITGTNNADFAQTNNCGSSVAAGKSCTFTVTFTPTATGTRSANLTITDYQAGSQTQNVPLTGTGTN